MEQIASMAETPPSNTPPPTLPINGSWGTYQYWVLQELARHSNQLNTIEVSHAESLNKINEALGKINTSITVLQLKSGLWGAAAAMTATLGLAILKWLGGV